VWASPGDGRPGRRRADEAKNMPGISVKPYIAAICDPVYEQVDAENQGRVTEGEIDDPVPKRRRFHHGRLDLSFFPWPQP